MIKNPHSLKFRLVKMYFHYIIPEINILDPLFDEYGNYIGFKNKNKEINGEKLNLQKNKVKLTANITNIS